MASLSTLVPTNYVLTSGTNSVMSWTNVLTLSTANCSTVNASSMVTNSIGANALTLNSTLSVSTLTARSVNVSTITGSSISSNTLTLSLVNASTQNTQIYQVATTNPTTSYTAIQASHVSTGTTNNALALNPSGGNVGVGTTTPAQMLDITNATSFTPAIRMQNQYSAGYVSMGVNAGVNSYIGLQAGAATTSALGTPPFVVSNSGSGYVGIGTTAPQAALEVRNPTSPAILSCINQGGTQALSVYTGNAAITASWAGTNTVLYVAKDSSNNRSVNAAGTFNASGADYAEYMTKDSDFPALKGDLLGVLPSGKLTNQFDDAVHFLLKSTNPCMVGGDVWGTEDIVGERPKDLAKDATEEEKAAHAAALADWEARLEAERQKVDRMAFAGQVPVNIQGTTPGDYIIPSRNADGTIGVAAVSKVSFAQYQSAVGRVISILADGRANVIVKAV